MLVSMAMWRRRWSCWLIIASMLVFGSVSKVAESMRFELHSGVTKCIAADIKADTMSVGSYSLVNIVESDPKLTVRVTSPHGTSYHNGDNVEKGTFAFTASETGDYAACFRTPDSDPPTMVTVEFDWRSGVEAKDWSTVAKKGHIEAMEMELKKLSDMVRYIHEEMYYLRDREEEMQQLNRSTNSYMGSLGFFSLVVCISVAGLQLWHLKNYFERKKLL